MLKRRHVFMRTTKQVIPVAKKTFIYTKIKWKKNMWEFTRRGGAISVVPKRIFVPLKRYEHPKIEPKLFRARFVNRS